MSEWAESRSIPVTESGCWLWLGAEKGNGYGNVRKSGRNHPAHRRSWEESNGAIPNGLDVCHKCDTRLCINPEHLFLGSRKQNMQDCVAKGRQAKGKDLPHTKLDEVEVISARRLRASGWTMKSIADRFSVSRMTISRILNNKSWNHI